MQLGTVPTGATAPAARAGQAPGEAPSVTLGQLNVWNFFDAEDDPHARDTVYEPDQYRARLVKLAGLIARDMDAPDVVSLQEVENARVLDDLLAMPQLAGMGYQKVMSSKADTRGIRNAILYRATHLQLRSLEEPNPISTLPPEDPDLIGHDRLFARGSMVATFGLAGADDAHYAAFTLINNHFKSKVGGDFWEPRRRAQGAFIGGLVDALRGAEPNVPVLVTGDLNATWADGAYQALQRRSDGSARLHDALAALPESDRYTYVYRGTKNLLDHLLVTPDAADAIDGVRILHLNTRKDSATKRFNSRTTHGTSDHDPIVARLRLDPAPRRT